MTTPDTTTRPWTLSDIAASQGVIKRTAQGWLAKAKAAHGDIGELINGVRHFSLEERDLLISYAAPPRPAKVEPAAPVQTEAFPDYADHPNEYRQVEVITGNHRASLAPPAMPSHIDLAKFRGDIEVRSYKDPVNEAAVALALFDAVGSAMDADLDAQFTQLETTAATVQQLEQGAEKLKEKQLEYQITQKILARLQNQKTSELTSLLGKAQALGGGGGQ